MNPKDRERAFIDAWKVASQLLEEQRAHELPTTDTVKGLQALLPAFDQCVRATKLLGTSGLIEQQRVFSRYRRS